jgi:hypothetical protein
MCVVWRSYLLCVCVASAVVCGVLYEVDVVHNIYFYNHVLHWRNNAGHPPCQWCRLGNTCPWGRRRNLEALTYKEHEQPIRASWSTRLAGAIVHVHKSQLDVGGGLMMGGQGKEAVASQLPLSCTKYYLSLTTLASHPHPPASTTACCRHETKSQTCGSREVVTRTQQSENVCNKSERGQSPCLKLRVPMPQHQS